MVRVDGIEPTSRVWKTRVLPLNDTRMVEAPASQPGLGPFVRGVYARRRRFVLGPGADAAVPSAAIFRF